MPLQQPLVPPRGTAGPPRSSDLRRPNQGTNGAEDNPSRYLARKLKTQKDFLKTVLSKIRNTNRGLRNRRQIGKQAEPEESKIEQIYVK